MLHNVISYNVVLQVDIAESATSKCFIILKYLCMKIIVTVSAKTLHVSIIYIVPCKLM